MTLRYALGPSYEQGHIRLVLTAPALYGDPAASKQFGSEWADALFTSHWVKPAAQEFYQAGERLGRPLNPAA
jgi:hypothetical protein